jgi:hypothetical protein
LAGTHADDRADARELSRELRAELGAVEVDEDAIAGVALSVQPMRPHADRPRHGKLERGPVGGIEDDPLEPRRRGGGSGGGDHARDHDHDGSEQAHGGGSTHFGAALSRPSRRSHAATSTRTP